MRCLFLLLCILSSCSIANKSDIYRDISIAQIVLGLNQTRCLFVLSSNANVISSFTIGTSGSLTPTSPSTVTASGAWQAIADPNGRHLYVTTVASGTIYDFTINKNTCALTDTGLTYALTSAYRPFMSADGKYLYVVRNTAANLTTYSIQTTTASCLPWAAMASAPGPWQAPQIQWDVSCSPSVPVRTTYSRSL